MTSRIRFRAGSVRALALVLGIASLPSHAATTPSFAAQVAQVAALPAAPALKEEDFLRRSRLSQVKLSPDGATLAFFESDGKDNALYALDLKTSAKKKLVPAPGRQELHWSSDSKVIFLDSGDGVAQVTLADGSSSKIAALDRKLEQHFVAVDPSKPQAVLLQSADRAAKQYRISRVNADGKQELLHESDKAVGDFLVDAGGQVSFIRTLAPDYTQIVSRREGGTWVEAARCKRLRACELITASADRRQLTMLTSYQNDRKALVRIDTASGKQHLLHTDPLAIADVRQVVQAPLSRTALVAVYDAPKRRNLGLTPAAARVGADIAKRFPDANVTLSPSENGATWLLTERGARLQHERYWTYDLATHRISAVLAEESKLGQPIPETQLASKIAVQYRGSDGALLHGYLSLPPGKDAAKIPLLTMVHGGPWNRVDSDYHSLVQLVVNRGVAVFQPNFRASTGHGDKYRTAPGNDFGNGRVQADIIDGVRYLTAHGVGDSKRLGIMGDSFGGYATLLALTHTPEMFRFGMATVPPTDFVRTMQASAQAPGSGDEVPFAVTLKETGIDLNDTAAMQKITDASPAANSAKVRRPVMILAGAKDKVVDVAGVTDYVARLQGNGAPVSFLLDPDEGHNPRKPIVRQAYMHLLTRLLHQYLGAPPPAAPSAELASYLQQTIKVDAAFTQ